MAARRDGRANPSIGPDPRCHHGDRWRVPCLPYVAAAGIRTRGKTDHRHHRCLNRVFRRDCRSRAERHQTRHRLFDLQPAWLHVCRRWLWRLFRGHVPPVHACLLQGDAVPWRGFGDPRHAPRTRHAQLWRPTPQNPAHLRRHADRNACHHRRRHPADGDWLCRIPVQRRGDRGRLRWQQLRFHPAGDRCLHDQLLFMATDFPHLLWQTTRRSSRLRSRPRIPQNHAGAFRCFGARGGILRHDLVQFLLWRRRKTA